jgi:hypothetical protein
LWEYFGPSVRIANEETRRQFPAKPLLISALQRAVNFEAMFAHLHWMENATRLRRASLRREVTLPSSALEQTWCNAGWTA